MQSSDFQAVLAKIPRQSWEASLSIGRFSELEVLKVMSRPFSIVGRCKVYGDSGEQVVYIKKYRQREGRTTERQRQKMLRDIEASNFWYQHFADDTRFRVVKPLLALPEQLITVSEESRGESLFELLNRDARRFVSRGKMAQLRSHLFNVGQWLQVKQQKMLVSDKAYDLDELCQYIELRLKLLCEDARRRFPVEYRKAVLAFLDQHLASVPASERLVTTNHSDFNPGNVLVNGKVVTVLDFGRLVDGPYLLDISKLYFQLALFSFKPQFNPKTIRALQAALLDGFGDKHAEQREMFRLLMIRNISTHLLNITRYWKFPLPVKGYNRWVANRELKMLDELLKGDRRQSTSTPREV